MAVSPDKINEILNFHPARKAGSGEVDLGSIDGSTRVVYGPQTFEERVIVHPEERRTGRLRTQPVVSLITEQGVYPLPYATEIRRLPENVIEQVADRLAAHKRLEAIRG